MSRLERAFWSSLLALSGVACAAPDTALEAPPRASPTPSPTPSPSAPGDFTSCAWAVDWSTEASNAQVGPKRLSLDPSGTLLYSGDVFGGMYFRRSDGAALAPDRSSVPMVFDATWSQAVELVDTRFVVRDLPSAAPITTGDLASSWGSAVAFAGERVVSVHCEASRAGTAVSVRAVDAVTGAVVPTPAIDGACVGFGGHAPKALLSRDGGRLWILGLAGGDVARVDLDRNTVRIARGVVGDDDGQHFDGDSNAYDGASVLGAALSPDEREITLTGWDDLLRTLDADTLDAIGEARAVASIVAMDDTFVPTLESPVAYTPGGTLIAHLDTAGALVLRSRADGQVRGTLVPPFVDLPWRPDTAATPSAVMDLAFDDGGLVVAYESGLVRFACTPPVRATEGPALEVTVTPPTAPLIAGQGFTLRLAVVGAQGNFVSAVYVDDTAVRASVGLEVPLVAYEVGTHRAQVRVTDGVHSGVSAAFTFDVRR